MMSSFLKKTSWIVLALALAVGTSQAVLAADDTSDDSSAKSAASKKNNADAKLKKEIQKKIQQRLTKENQANSKLLQGLQACQGKYTVTMPQIGQVTGVAYSKRQDMRGGAQCVMEVYRSLEKETGKFHPCIGEPRFDPANMAAGIFNLDADVDVEHDNEYSVQDLTRMCAIMGVDGESGSSAGLKCAQHWYDTYDVIYKRPVRFWAGEAQTLEKIGKYACNLTKKETVEDGDTPDSLNVYAFCTTLAQEKAECMNGQVNNGSTTAAALQTCEVECYNSSMQYADLFHYSTEDEENGSISKEEREEAINEAMQECYTDSWTPSPSCLTAPELAPIMPETSNDIVTEKKKKLTAEEKKNGKKSKDLTQDIIGMMMITPNEETKTKGEKAYVNNANSVRENQNKIKVNAASRAIALGKRAVWLGITSGEEIEKLAKRLEYSDDFLTMFKGIAELQAQHLQKTSQNTALKAKLSELSSIDGIISGNLVTTNEEALQNAGTAGGSESGDEGDRRTGDGF